MSSALPDRPSRRQSHEDNVGMKDVFSSDKEISATERLLQAIRGESSSKDASPPSPLSETSPPSPWSRLSARGGLLPFPTRTTLGIDLGHQQLRMVLIAQTGDHRWNLLGYRRVPLPTTAPGDSSEFAEFLNAAVQDFAGFSKKMRVWGLISAAHVDVRHVRIPKVPRKQIYNAAVGRPGEMPASARRPSREPEEPDGFYELKEDLSVNEIIDKIQNWRKVPPKVEP